MCMKKVRRVIGMVILLCYIMGNPVCAAEEPSFLYAKSAVLLDAVSGRVLYGKAETEVLPMASTTKIITALVAIESLEKLNKSAHIAATDERVVLVWDDSIVANFPRPEPKDWNGFGEITTALILKMRAYDPGLRGLSESEMYQVVVDSLIRGVDENGRYIFSKAIIVSTSKPSSSNSILIQGSTASPSISHSSPVL